jgi:hypothetical protein
MAGKLALKFTLYFCGFWTALLLLYVAASGPVLHHAAVKKQNTTLMPWRYSQPSIPRNYRPAAPPPAGYRAVAGYPYAFGFERFSLSSPENLYTPLFDTVEKTPLQAPLDNYLRWWGVNSMRVCSNALTIFPSRPTK